MDPSTAADGAAKILTLNWTSASILIGTLFIVLIALLAFVLWRNYKREAANELDRKSMLSRHEAERKAERAEASKRENECNERVQHLQSEIRDVLVREVGANREAVNNCSRSMDDLKETNREIVGRLCDVLAKR